MRQIFIKFKFKDTLNHENLNRKRRERNNPSVESNDENDNATKKNLPGKNKTDRPYKRVIRPHDSDDFENNTHDETSIDSELCDQEFESSDEDEIDFNEDDAFVNSDSNNHPCTSKKKRKFIQK